MRDLANNITPKRGLSPKAATTDNTAYASEILDRLGFDSVTWLTLIGANTDANATFAVLVEDGDAANLSDAAAVDDKYLIGTEALAGFDFSHDNQVRKIGYVGPKRYVRVTITPSGNDSGNVFIAGVWVLGHPRYAPTANPPA